MGKGISRGIAFLAILSMVVLAACGGGNSADKAGTGELAEKQEITLGNIPSEPPGLESLAGEGQCFRGYFSSNDGGSH